MDTTFTTLLATSGCRTLIISKLSAQQPQCASRVLGGLVVWMQHLWSTLLGHLKTCLSCLEKFARVDGQYYKNKHAACTSGTCGIISSSRSCSNPFWVKKF